MNRAARAAYNASGAKKGAAGPPSLKAAAFAVKGLVGAFARASSGQSEGAFSRISSAGSVWQLEGMIPKPKLKHIETLYLTHNLLQQLPDAVSNLRTLKQLWLNANRCFCLLPSFLTPLTVDFTRAWLIISPRSVQPGRAACVHLCTRKSRDSFLQQQRHHARPRRNRLLRVAHAAAAAVQPTWPCERQLVGGAAGAPRPSHKTEGTGPG